MPEKFAWICMCRRERGRERERERGRDGEKISGMKALVGFWESPWELHSAIVHGRRCIG